MTHIEPKLVSDPGQTGFETHVICEKGLWQDSPIARGLTHIYSKFCSRGDYQQYYADCVDLVHMTSGLQLIMYGKSHSGPLSAFSFLSS